MAFMVRRAVSKVQFDLLKWIFKDFSLIGFRTLVVSNVVHNLCDDSSNLFHARVTARQMLRAQVSKSILVETKSMFNLHSISHRKVQTHHFCKFKRQVL